MKRWGGKNTRLFFFFFLKNDNKNGANSEEQLSLSLSTMMRATHTLKSPSFN